MLKRLLVLAIAISLGMAAGLAGQDAQGKQIYFKFEYQDFEELSLLTRLMSIDNVSEGTVYAYATEDQFEYFKTLGYAYEILPDPGSLIRPRMSDNIDEIKEWNSYPTYDAYVSMMYQFEADYPALCRVESIGNSVNGRELLVAKLSADVDVEEAEPEVFYTSTMHGDETVGYILCLRLIDSLLSTYGTDPRVTQMLDNMEVYINPLANPDGLYYGGNNTIWQAIRYNYNYVDLNRNFPDPDEGPHPDGNPWQPETIAMMEFAEAHSLIISANFHSGAEVVNYPWDTWPRLHPDDVWFIDISREYADTAHAHSPSGYMTDLNNGITNGYAWYTIAGGRQDYMNYYHGCREVTIELSHVMLLPENQLEDHWEYNRISLLQYLENAYYGIRGTVTDQLTALPVDATIYMLDHDRDNSMVYTDPDIGDYYRMIEAGMYDIRYYAHGYYPLIIEDIAIGVDEVVTVNAELESYPGEADTVFFDDFSSNLGWTGLGGDAEWTIGAAAGGRGNDNYGGPDPSTDHSPGSDNGVMGNDLTPGTGGDYNPNINSTCWITSPVIDCSDYFNVRLKFFRWLGVERNRYDHAYLQVYDGSRWVSLFENGSTTIDESEWNGIEYDLWQIADGNSEFRIRFGLGRTDGSWQYCGWNIDDLEVTGFRDLRNVTVSIDMIPDNPPVTVPAGGLFTYTGIIMNNTDRTQTIDVWLMLRLPSGYIYGPLRRFNDVMISPYDTISVDGIRQHVPGYAPLGLYDYIAYCGDYPDEIVDSASFQFTATEPAGDGAGGWNVGGWFDQPSELLPEVTALRGNYPNPFNAVTTVEYDLARDGHVVLEVFNLLGQRVETLVNGYQNAGGKSVTWNASDRASGVYYYRLSAGGVTSTKKMVLLK